MDEERIGLFIDYENLAIGARIDLKGHRFDFKPIADALAERGRVVVRRAYADWSSFVEDRKMLTRNHVELIEIPQRLGAVRKNAADIKMAVDAVELAFERGYITTFVVCTGDSDFTPLVHKLRELNKRVIGVGLRGSTSALLPPACDEFLFYERLAGVDLSVTDSSDNGEEQPAEAEPSRAQPESLDRLTSLLTGTLAGLERSSEGPVRSSQLKRTLLRKDPTFSETDYGFRAFGELLAHLEEKNVLELDGKNAGGDPVVHFSSSGDGESVAFSLLQKVVAELQGEGPVALSGLKNELRKRQRGFSEKKYGYSGFLQFVKAADARGLVSLEWSKDLDQYQLTSTS